MQAAREMAGYSLGSADLLRRAMGKKKPEEMAKQKLIFIDGARKNGHSSEDAERVFELMSYFSGYGFNKSHSAAYALIAYQCAYLKAHYPVEFLCATMTADKDKVERVVRTVAEARAMGITVLPPDVNESEEGFGVVYGLPTGEPRVATPFAGPQPLRQLLDLFATAPDLHPVGGHGRLSRLRREHQQRRAAGAVPGLRTELHGRRPPRPPPHRGHRRALPRPRPGHTVRALRARAGLDRRQRARHSAHGHQLWQQERRCRRRCHQHLG